jgi:DNA-binding transcriptional LysR family regulator
MDLRRVKTFVTVAEHGTISKAAQLLRITQPALSRQIGALEDEIGFRLFQREGRRLVLTVQGEHLLGDCRGLLSHAATVTERVQSLRRGEIRVLNIAASALTIEGFFPTFLPRYAEIYPDVRLNLVEARPAELLSMLERGEAHLAVNPINVMNVDDHRFGSFLLPHFEILAACAPSLDIDGPDAIEIRRLVDHPLLLPNVSYATRELFDAACRLAGVRPNIFIESAAAHALLAFAEAGHGVAVIPSVLRPARSPLRVMRVIHRGDPLRIAVAVIWDKQRTLPQYADNFSELLAQHLRERFPQPRPAAPEPVALTKLQALTAHNLAARTRTSPKRKVRSL